MRFTTTTPIAAALPALRLVTLLALLASLPACTDTTRPICEPGVPCEHASELACKTGLEATLYGRAAFSNGTCAARDDATCRASTLTCAYFGQCAFSPTHSPGPCPATTDRDFHASRNPACLTNTCVAATDADCAASHLCAEEGRCTANDGICVATDATCRKSHLCTSLGWCATRPNGQCRPATPTDCQASYRCARTGDCGLRGDTCAACNRADACRSDGLCTLVKGSCRATDPQHCRSSDACKTSSRCRPYQGACVR